jgi:methionyl-tRNA formyltransferase
MAEIKLILLCSSRFAIPAIRQLHFLNQLSVVAIPHHCTEMIEETNEVLKGSNVPVMVLDKSSFREQLISTITEHSINTGLIMTFSYMLPPSVYQLPQFGFFNVHPGLLPGYRGADPIFQQIKNREKNAGVAIHKLEENADAGAIVIQEMIPISADDTYGILTGKLAQLAEKLVNVLLKIIGYGFNVPAKPQDESKARYFKRQGAKDIIIDWELMDADSIIALINACNPWNKGAVTKINNKIIRLLEAEKTEYSDAIPQQAGTIFAITDEGMTIATCDNQLIKVDIIFMDEGILNSSRLIQFGLTAGNQFEKIS